MPVVPSHPLQPPGEVSKELPPPQRFIQPSALKPSKREENTKSAFFLWTHHLSYTGAEPPKKRITCTSLVIFALWWACVVWSR